MEVQWIRGMGGVEWLSIGMPGQSGDDAEAQQIRAAVTRRRGERRRDGLESWRWVRNTVAAQKHGGSEAVVIWRHVVSLDATWMVSDFISR
jgi:hypothetical protein